MCGVRGIWVVESTRRRQHLDTVRHDQQMRQRCVEPYWRSLQAFRRDTGRARTAPRCTRLAKDAEQRVTVARIGSNTARRVADVLRCILALPLVQASSTSSPATRCAHCTVHSLASDPRRYDAARRSVDRLMDCLSQCKRAALKCKQCSELVRDGRVDEALVTGRCAIPRPSARVRTHAATVSRAHTLGLRACISVLVVARARR